MGLATTVAFRTTFPGSSVNAKQNQEDGLFLAASHPRSMLQTFLITSIKSELKILIINILQQL
jgi:hypothetical protein